jgi:hypothetical protein
MTTLGVVARTSSSPREPATVINIAEDNVRRVVKALLAAQDEVSAVEVGEYLGVGKGAIYNRLKGVKPFTVGEVAALSRMFGVPVDVFFAGPAALFRSIPESRAGGRAVAEDGRDVMSSDDAFVTGSRRSEARGASRHSPFYRPNQTPVAARLFSLDAARKARARRAGVAA